MNTITYWTSTQGSIKAVLMSATLLQYIGPRQSRLPQRVLPKNVGVRSYQKLRDLTCYCRPDKIGDLQARFTKAIHDPAVNPFLPTLQSRRLISSLPRLPQTARIELPVLVPCRDPPPPTLISQYWTPVCH